MDEQLKAVRRDGAKILWVIFIALVFALLIGYFAGYIDSVEKFNTSSKIENFYTRNDTLWYNGYKVDGINIFVLDLKRSVYQYDEDN